MCRGVHGLGIGACGVECPIGGIILNMACHLLRDYLALMHFFKENIWGVCFLFNVIRFWLSASAQLVVFCCCLSGFIMLFKVHFFSVEYRMK